MEHRRASRFMRTPQTNLSRMRRDVNASMQKRISRRNGFRKPPVRRLILSRNPINGAAPLAAGLAIVGAAACSVEKSQKEKMVDLVQSTNKVIVTGPDGSKTVQEVELTTKVRENIASGYIGAAACGIEAGLILAMMIVAVRTWRKMDDEPGKDMKSAL